jgi:DNA-binding FadR family transcriptional regulator
MRKTRATAGKGGAATLDEKKEISSLAGRFIVRETAAKIRKLVLASAPDTRLGSLRGLADSFGVGIVTVQQAARILEYEGLLEVRRGQRGGYFGRRPNEAALERSIAAYMHEHGSVHFEAMDIMSQLLVDLAAAAAHCKNEALFAELNALLPTIESCSGEDSRIDFEDELLEILFRMVDKPFTHLLSRITMRLYRSRRTQTLFRGKEGHFDWQHSRSRLIRAVLERDAALARFEATRNRQMLLNLIGGTTVRR